MASISKQIDYWITSAKDDLTTAKLLIAENRLLHGLFFCHLVIEKVIKAHVTKQTQKVPPRSHNLIFLSESARLKFRDSDEALLGILMKYQLQGRYPDYNPVIPDVSKANNYLVETEKLMIWLIARL